MIELFHIRYAQNYILYEHVIRHPGWGGHILVVLREPHRAVSMEHALPQMVRLEGVCVQDGVWGQSVSMEPVCRRW